MNKLYSYVMLFAIVSVMAFFMAIFVYQVGDQYILTEIESVANSSYDQLGISNEMQNSISGNLDEYRNLNIPYDLFFLASWISVLGLSIITAYNSREQSYYSFFGGLTLGLMLFLVVTGIVTTITDWIVVNLIQNVVNFNIETTPIFNFYISNLGIINFLWAFILLTINKLPFTLNRREDFEDNFDELPPEVQR